MPILKTTFIHTTLHALLAFGLSVLLSTAQAQNIAQPREVKLFEAPLPAPAPTPANNPRNPAAGNVASASAAANTNAVRPFIFTARELTTKFFLPGSWTIASNQMTTAGTVTRLIPQGQAVNAFNQRITVQELPSWTNATRLGKEYLNDIMDDCATGNMATVEQGNVSKMAAEVVMLECADAPSQTIKLAYAVIVQGAKSNLVFSRMVRVAQNNPQLQAIAKSELANFKTLIGGLYVCMPNNLELCR